MSDFINPVNLGELNSYIELAVTKLNSMKKVTTCGMVAGRTEQNVESGFRIRNINCFNASSCRITFEMLDRSVKENDVVRGCDTIDILVFRSKQKGTLKVYTEEEHESYTRHCEEIDRIIETKGIVYICGNYTGKDDGFNVYAVSQKYDAENDIVTIHRYNNNGKIDLGVIDLEFDEFCQYYRFADENEKKKFYENYCQDREER